MPPSKSKRSARASSLPVADPPLLSLAMIVRNEAAGLARCLASVAGHVDEIIILDTGSRDASKAIARRFTGKIRTFAWRDDFAEARNKAFSYATGTWVLWLDGDDEVTGAELLREACRSAPDDVSALCFPYYVGSGTMQQVLWRERCVRRDLYHWRGAVHEVLVPLAPEHGKQMQVQAITVQHHGKQGHALSSLQRNVRILRRELTAAEVPDPRTLFYLARDLMLLEDYDEALEYFRRYVPVAVWKDEEYLALCYMARIYTLREQYAAADEIALHALLLCPHWPSAYFQLAETACYRRSWDRVVTWSEMGARCGHPDTPLFFEPEALDYRWIIYYTMALYHTGQLEKGRMWTERALAFHPRDAQHRYNLEVFNQALAARDAEATK